jgi:hypothetical protein
MRRLCLSNLRCSRMDLVNIPQVVYIVAEKAVAMIPATGSLKDATATIIFSQNQNDDILKM